MSNLELYTQCFCDSFGITPEQCAGLKYQDIPEWDSVGHMQLVAALEETFDIMMDTEDILEMESFEKIMEILGRYDVEF